MKKALTLILTLICALLISSCYGGLHSPFLSKESRIGGILSEETVRLNSSAPALNFERAVVLTDNDSAFEEKLRLIRGATKNIDMIYYIFADDYSASLFSRELIAAAQRGVSVRLLVDYFSAYPKLDFFRMLEQRGAGGAGRLEVRFFNRPSDVILQDAVYMTSPCLEQGGVVDYPQCAADKYRRIAKALSEQRRAEALSVPGVPSNYSTDASRMFLSGLYGKDAELLAQAVRMGNLKDKDADPAAVSVKDKESRMRSAIAAAKVFWQTRSTNEDSFERHVAEAKLWLVFLFYGGSLQPLYDRAAARFPIARPAARESSLRDWQFLTQFTHHKLLLVDETRLVLGGRNVQDAYHMQKNELVPGYVFSDTDMLIELREKDLALTRSFLRLWNYRTMTASLADVLTHAPNDLLAAKEEAAALCSSAGQEKEKAVLDACLEKAIFQNLDAELRISRTASRMEEMAQVFERSYRSADISRRSPSFPVDSGAKLYYLENLPFSKDDAAPEPRRLYQPENGREGDAGKHIHAAWLASLRQACTLAASGTPQKVFFHSAYFLPPANLLSAFAKMTGGTWNCGNVELSVITNSPETTDLNVINFAARYLLRAYFSYLNENRGTRLGAVFRYYEYQRQGEAADRSELSLHSKVNVIGPDIYVGSANADLRSYVLDTNNSVLIREAPVLREAYLQWLGGRLNNPSLIKEHTGLFSAVSQEELIEKDREYVRRVLGKLMPPDNPAISPVAEFIVELLVRLGDLSEKIIKEKKANSLNERKYDALFKLL